MTSSMPPPPTTPTGPPPGWYTTGGAQRWWDGNAWGPIAPPVDGSANQSEEERGNVWAMLSHLSPFALAIIGPIIIRQTEGAKSSYVKHHATEALNFQLTVFIGAIASLFGGGILAAASGPEAFMFGFLMYGLVVVVAFVFLVMATIATAQNKWYRYPISIRMVPGAQRKAP